MRGAAAQARYATVQYTTTVVELCLAFMFMDVYGLNLKKLIKIDDVHHLHLRSSWFRYSSCDPLFKVVVSNPSESILYQQ